MSTPGDFMKHIRDIAHASGPNDPVVRILVSPSFMKQLKEHCGVKEDDLGSSLKAPTEEATKIRGIPVEERAIMENFTPPYVCIRRSLDEQLMGVTPLPGWWLPKAPRIPNVG